MEDAVVTKDGDVVFPAAKLDLDAPYVVKEKNIFFILNYLDNRGRTVSTFVEPEEA